MNKVFEIYFTFVVIFSFFFFIRASSYSVFHRQALKINFINTQKFDKNYKFFQSI